MKIAIIINAERLTDDLKEKLSSDALQKYQIDYDIYLPKPADFESVLQEIKKKPYQVFLICGGDGTVRQAVDTLWDVEKPIAVLPIGTFNLFAKTLQLPNDIEKIFEIIKNNKTKLIDLTSVNDNIIINHAWIGFYYSILKLREKHKQLLGKSKLLKSIFNTLAIFRSLPIYTLEMNAEGKAVSYKTCLVYIGNNEFYTSLFDMGERKTLSSGLMSVTILTVKNRWQLFLCMLDLIFGNTKQSKYITYFCTDAFSIVAKSPQINVVLDGELFKLQSPLHFRNDKKKLKVMVP